MEQARPSCQLDSFTKLTIRLCDDLISMAKLSHDETGERLARELKTALRFKNEEEIARVRRELEAHADLLESLPS
jgi:hypothetical protein